MRRTLQKKTYREVSKQGLCYFDLYGKVMYGEHQGLRSQSLVLSLLASRVERYGMEHVNNTVLWTSAEMGLNPRQSNMDCRFRTGIFH